MNQKKNAIGYESLGIDLPEEIKLASGDALFQYLVDRLKDFLAHSTRIPQVVRYRVTKLTGNGTTPPLQRGA